MSNMMMGGQMNELGMVMCYLPIGGCQGCRARSIQVVSCHSFYFSLSFHYLSLGLPSSPRNPLFQWHLQSREILLNLSMKC
jgi:hypothetical protein